MEMGCSGTRRQGLELLVGAVEPGRAARIHLRQAAAGEVVVHLGAHRLDGLERRRRARPQRHHAAGLARPLPLGEGLELLPEGVQPRLVEPGEAAPVLDAAGAGHGVDDDLARLRVLGRLGRHHAVAVEGGPGEDVAQVLHVVRRDLAGLRLAQAGQDASGRAEQRLPLRRGVVDDVERQGVLAGHEGAQVLEPRPAPAERRQDLGGAHPAVLVQVQQRQCPLVELQPLDRAGERHPELLVQVLQVREVAGRLQRHLVEPADSVEAPAMSRLVRRRGHLLPPEIPRPPTPPPRNL
jgi:hypothetical protein